MSKPQPQYLKLKQYIVRHITNGDWPPLGRIPSENELAAEFGIARMTVNRALRELAHAGILTRTQGSGTFVAEPKAESTMFEVRSIRDEILARGCTHSVKVLTLESISARLVVARQFELESGVTLHHSRLLHLADDKPVQLEDRFVNPMCAPDYLTVDFHKETPHQYLMRMAPLQRAEHSIEAEVASVRVASTLSIQPGAPLLVLTRRTWSRNHIASYVRLTHPADRYRFVGTFRIGDASIS